MGALLKSKQEYQAVTIMRVLWDSNERDEIAKALGVTHRSTLVMVKGEEIVGTVEWSSSKDKIEALFKAVI